MVRTARRNAIGGTIARMFSTTEACMALESPMVSSNRITAEMKKPIDTQARRTVLRRSARTWDGSSVWPKRAI